MSDKKQESLRALDMFDGCFFRISNDGDHEYNFREEEIKKIRAALTEAPKVDVKPIIETWVSVWNQRLNPPLTFNDLDKFEAFAEWLATNYDLVKKEG